LTKISIIGAGFVGATTVQRLADNRLGDLVLVDIIEGMPQGKALDLIESAPILGFDINILGTNDYKDIKGSDIIVITAGIARKPGMSRDDLVKINSRIISEICSNIIIYAPSAVIIVVTNPLDLMTYIAFKKTGFSSRKVLGMSGVLDSGRFAAFIAMELGCSVKDVDTMVLGGHGDSMVPLLQFTTVSGIPISELMDQQTIDRLVARTINGGAEIVNLLKTGSAFYAPSAAITTMVESIVCDHKHILPASAYLTGQYGYSDIFLGVPVKLGRAGIEQIIELKLTDSEQAMLDRSAEAVKQGIAKLDI
jgi:malate dehydrogenase